MNPDIEKFDAMIILVVSVIVSLASVLPFIRTMKLPRYTFPEKAETSKWAMLNNEQ